MDFQQIQVEIRGAVGILRLNAPDKLNALTPLMVSEISTAIDHIAQHCRAMIITGAGRAFCSGASLDPKNPLSPVDQDPSARDLGLVLEQQLNPIMLKLKNLDIPWISAVRGAAAGFGASLALAADMILASETAYFAQIFSKIGLVPDGGASHLLSRTIGRVRTMELMFLGNRLSAENALAWGLVNRVVNDTQLEEQAFSLATTLANGPSQALGMTRKAIWAATDDSWELTLKNEREQQKIAGRSIEFDEGLAAFTEKRPAAFNGQ
jgi:2-(1,2-epoxy-1,2-dihydrophenyl)acetyl-CoA isomerase